MIHIAKKRLGMDEDAYRSLIHSISNQRTDTAADLSGPERQALLKHMQTCGFKVERKRAFPDTPLWMRAYAEWQKLADAGAVRSRSGYALAGFVVKHAGVENAVWVKANHLNNAIEALKDWGARTKAKNERCGSEPG